ncbi:hypothetical protein ACFSTD_19655 [Novosphingobium colocasiae]
MPADGCAISLFWQSVMPDRKLGFQAYLYLTNEGKAGFNIVVWGEEKAPDRAGTGQRRDPGRHESRCPELQGSRTAQDRVRRSGQGQLP